MICPSALFRSEVIARRGTVQANWNYWVVSIPRMSAWGTTFLPHHSAALDGTTKRPRARMRSKGLEPKAKPHFVLFPTVLQAMVAIAWFTSMRSRFQEVHAFVWMFQKIHTSVASTNQSWLEGTTVPRSYCISNQEWLEWLWQWGMRLAPAEPLLF